MPDRTNTGTGDLNFIDQLVTAKVKAGSFRCDPLVAVAPAVKDGELFTVHRVALKLGCPDVTLAIGKLRLRAFAEYLEVLAGVANLRDVGDGGTGWTRDPNHVDFGAGGPLPILTLQVAAALQDFEYLFSRFYLTKKYPVI